MKIDTFIRTTTGSNIVWVLGCFTSKHTHTYTSTNTNANTNTKTNASTKKKKTNTNTHKTQTCITLEHLCNQAHCIPWFCCCKVLAHFCFPVLISLMHPRYFMLFMIKTFSQILVQSLTKRNSYVSLCCFSYIIKASFLSSTTGILWTCDQKYTWSHDDVIKCKHFPRCWYLRGEFTGHRWIPHTKASDAELWCFIWSTPELPVAQTIVRLVISDPSRSFWRHRNASNINDFIVWIHVHWRYVCGHLNSVFGLFGSYKKMVIRSCYIISFTNYGAFHQCWQTLHDQTVSYKHVQI